MKFAVIVNGKKYPVAVMREPKNISALSNFVYEGKTYRGIPTQFNGLKFDKLKDRYTATSIVVTEPNTASVVASEPKPITEDMIIENKPITEDIIIKNKQELDELLSVNTSDTLIIPENTKEDVCSENIEETEVTTEEISEEETSIEKIIEEEVSIDETDEYKEASERRREFLESLERESAKINRETQQQLSKVIKKITFQPRWSILFPESETYGEGLFQKHKHVWIKLHGSEHLKTAHEMQCRCDALYIQERAALEFKEWSIHDLLIYYEIDSPDYGILTYLKNFKNMHRDILNNYHSKIVLVTTDEYMDEDNPLVVITDYLGHCDLSIPFVNLVEIYGDRC